MKQSFIALLSVFSLVLVVGCGKKQEETAEPRGVLAKTQVSFNTNDLDGEEHIPDMSKNCVQHVVLKGNKDVLEFSNVACPTPAKLVDAKNVVFTLEMHGDSPAHNAGLAGWALKKGGWKVGGFRKHSVVQGGTHDDSIVIDQLCNFGRESAYRNSSFDCTVTTDATLRFTGLELNWVSELQKRDEAAAAIIRAEQQRVTEAQRAEQQARQNEQQANAQVKELIKKIEALQSDIQNAKSNIAALEKMHKEALANQKAELAKALAKEKATLEKKLKEMQEYADFLLDLLIGNE